MADPNHKGVCPNCDLNGDVGSLCTERSCNLRGYHFVPAEYATWTKTKRPDATVGKLIGRYLAVKVLGAGGLPHTASVEWSSTPTTRREPT